MAAYKQTTVELDHLFDRKSCRHYMNGQLSVLHCHHYSSLYTQLALDADFVDGTKLLTESAEDSFLEMLSNYFENYSINELSEKLEIGCQYYASLGLGKMVVRCIGENAGEVVLEKSHMDEGWMNKWGQADKPVNYISCGYIAALFAAIYGKGPRSYRVSEIQSIVTGAEQSKFLVVIN